MEAARIFRCQIQARPVRNQPPFPDLLAWAVRMPPGWIRTSDLRIRSCSFAGILCLVEPGSVGLGRGWWGQICRVGDGSRDEIANTKVVESAPDPIRTGRTGRLAILVQDPHRRKSPWALLREQLADGGFICSREPLEAIRPAVRP
jgi:hypothetical protein